MASPEVRGQSPSPTHPVEPVNFRFRSCKEKHTKETSLVREKQGPAGRSSGSRGQHQSKQSGEKACVWTEDRGWLPRTPEQPSVKEDLLGLPWWSSGKECASQCRGRGFDPWSGKIPRATGRAQCMSLCSRARAPQQETPPGKKPEHHSKEHPMLTAAREGPHAAAKTQHGQRERKKSLKIHFRHVAVY